MTRRRFIYPSDGSAPFEVSSDYIPEPRGPFVMGDLPAYESPVDGRPVEGRAQRREDLARHGCRPWEGMAQERKEAARQRAYADQRAEQALTRSIERSLMQISEGSRRILTN